MPIPHHAQERQSVPSPELVVEGLEHRFDPAGPPLLEIAAFALEPGARVALTGPSGAGKTTLAHLLVGIEPIRKGRVRWGPTALEGLTEAARDRFRRERVGLVFQDFHLVPGLSVLDNVLVSAWFAAWRPDPERVERARALLARCAVPVAGRRVDDLSRGERQRVAVARALLNRPPILMADEPTASLDPVAGGRVIDLLLEGAAETGATLLAVTHDRALIERLQATWRLERGRLERIA